MNASIPTERGYHLLARVFHSERKNTNQHVLIINSAMGVDMEFYFPFAEFVSSIGISVITYDYHVNSIGTRSDFRNLNAAIAACGAVDFEAVLRWTDKSFAGHSIHVMGHGMGGAICGLAKSLSRVNTLINIGVQIPFRFEIPKKYWISAWMNLIWLKAYFLFFRAFYRLKHQSLVGPSSLLTHQNLRFRSPDISEKCLKNKDKLFFDSFNGRLLTAIIPDETFFNSGATERFHAQFTNAKKAIRFLYAEELDADYVGFFGFFVNPGGQSHWEMATRWMTDTLPIHEDKYATFNDRELPFLIIEIAHRDPTIEMMLNYLETLKQYFLKGPVYMIMDMSRVHWANSRFLKLMAEWLKENRELVRTRHKGTAYACANPFVRYFITIFHGMDVFSVIKPVIVFKTLDQAKKWARLRWEEDSQHE